MRKRDFILKLVIIILIIWNAATSSAQVSFVNISSGWTFHEQDEARWYPAKVPGEVHTDLLANKLIPDPYYRDNEKKLQWIEKENYEYKTTFSVPAAVLNRKNIELVFDGLDTYASVYLNGQLILTADNIFR